MNDFVVSKNSKKWTLGYNRQVPLSCIRIPYCQRDDQYLDYKIHAMGDIDETLLQPLDVNLRSDSPEDSNLYCMDGGRRYHLCMMRDHKLVPVIIHNFPEQEESKYFLRLNLSRKPLITPEIFKGRIASGDPIAIGMVQFCRTYGLEISTTRKYASNKTIAAIAILECCWVNDPVALGKAFESILAIWGGTENSVNGAIIGGFTDFYHRYPEVSCKEVIRKLRHVGRQIKGVYTPQTPGQLIDRARKTKLIVKSMSSCGFKMSAGNTSADTRYVSFAIYDDYNYSRKKDSDRIIEDRYMVDLPEKKIVKS